MTNPRTCPSCNANRTLLIEMLNEAGPDSENRDLAQHLRSNCRTCTATIQKKEVRT